MDDTLLRLTIENIPAPIVYWDRQLRCVFANKICQEWFGQTEIAGKTMAEVIGPEAYELDRPYAEKALNGERQIFDRTFSLPDGKRKNIRFHYIPDDHGPEVAGFIFLALDPTEIGQGRQEDHVRVHAYHDPLTGLPNRQLVIDRLQQATERSRRTGRPVATMFIDLDRFKIVNDSLGHNVGDELLVEVSDRLQHCVRKSDTVGRWGGDEFIVILSDFAAITDVADVANKIIDLVAQPVDLRGREIQVGASIGITIFPQDGDSPEDLLKHADIAMYRSKASSRGGFHFFHQSMNAHAVERMELEARLRRAVEDREFELYFQPKVNIALNQVEGAEALIRWNQPTLGVVAPNRFIPLAEETGLILPIGDWVIGEACRHLRIWRETGIEGLTLSVNLSARQFLDPELPECLENHLRINGVDPERLEVELTESAVMTDPARAVITLQRIRSLGLGVSVDDFGTGYSSLAYLKRFPINAVKIDRSFINEITSDPDAAAIVNTIITLGHTLNLKTVAEGVETGEQLIFLGKAGCTSAQGYFYSRPLRAKDFLAWLAERNKI